MATTEPQTQPAEQPVDKGLKQPAQPVDAGILPVAGGLILFFLGGWSVWLDHDVATANDYTMWTVPGIHWQIGGAFVIAAGAALVGVICYLYCRFTNPAFFKRHTLTRNTATLIPDD